MAVVARVLWVVWHQAPSVAAPADDGTAFTSLPELETPGPRGPERLRFVVSRTYGGRDG